MMLFEYDLLQLPIIIRMAIVVCTAIPLIYLFHCFLAKQWLSIEFYRLSVMMSVAFVVMSILEASFGFIHSQLFDWRLWEYRIKPNHQGYGTYLGFFTWPWYGFHLYLLDKVLKGKAIASNMWLKGSLSGIDGPLLEIVGNGLFLIFFNRYVFYYFPSELNHLTSLYVIPHYAIAGIILAFIMRTVLQAEKSWSIPVSFYFLGCCFLIIG